MLELKDEKCEWAVNHAGDVMLACPQFHSSSLDFAVINRNYIIIRYDWFLRAKILIPQPVLPFIINVPSILLVVFNAEGNIVEIELQIRKNTAPNL
jgi:hypothetical protein